MSTHKLTLFITVASAVAAHFIVSLTSQEAAKGVATAIATPTSVAPSASVAPETAIAMIGMEENVSSPHNQVPKLRGPHPRLDLAFCIDTTGSMQGEIDTVKAKVKSMVAKLTSGQPKPRVRVGLVAYRDKGDDYVTKVFPFSDNIDEVVKHISNLNADGGGDEAEAVDAGMHAALNKLAWDRQKSTAKVLFLIGDAPPHSQVDHDWKAESREAIANGIRINTIGCAGVENNEAVPVFKKIASLTNGNFEFLSYHEEVVNVKGQKETLITSGGVTYAVKGSAKGKWKEGVETLVAKGDARPLLQAATNGTIGPQGADGTVISGVNTAGSVSVRADNNLDDVMLKGAQDVVNNVFGGK